MEEKKKQLKYMHLQQSYLDAWNSYAGHLEQRKKDTWDYVILTASNQEQAGIFEAEIKYRLENGFLPANTKYEVIPDPDGRRIGSGGATLHVIRYLAEKEHLDGSNFFKGKRVLVIHSGGDSKRLPQYSVCGKLFAPIPRELPNGCSSTLFDEILISVSMIPGQMREGMLVASGESLLLFNGLEVDVQFSGAACIAVKQDVEESAGKYVLLADTKNQVESVVRKMSPRQMKMIGMVDGQGKVPVGTGMVLMDADLLYSLYSLISTSGRLDINKYNRFVNEGASLSFHGDILGTLASKTTLSDYLKGEYEDCNPSTLEQCRRSLWECLHGYRMRLITVSPAELMSCETTRELLDIMTEKIDYYSKLGWKRSVHAMRLEEKKRSTMVNTLVTDQDTVKIGNHCYIENCYIGKHTFVGDHSIVSDLQLFDVVIPANVVLHGVKEKHGGYVVRIYGVSDNPKALISEDATFMNASFSKFLKSNDLEESDLWEPGEKKNLWNAKLYMESDTMREATECALRVYRMALSQGTPEDITWFKNSVRQSMSTSFAAADGKGISPWREKLQNYITIERYVNRIVNGMSQKEALKVFGSGVKQGQYQLLQERADNGALFERLRILIGLAEASKRKVGHYDTISRVDLEEKLFDEIQKGVAEDVFSRVNYDADLRAKRDNVEVQMPVRVNWGGGWTDTPPFCLEHGGAVLNAAVAVRNQLPIRAYVRKIPEYKIVLQSQNGSAQKEFTSLSELQDCGNAYDLFALHKAALLCCGILPRGESEKTLEEILREFGSGLSLSTEVLDIPRGSGLGLNSILAGACVKALYMFTERSCTQDHMFHLVLAIEQMMGAGGGWQDGVGGLLPGVKFTTTSPGIRQDMKVENVIIPQDGIQELNRRFVMVNTGLRRSSKSVVRNIIKKYLSSDTNTCECLNKMMPISVLMRFCLERGDIDGFAKLLDEHWELSIQLYEQTTNDCIEEIISACEDLIDAKFIAGVGGGGFLQFILKKGVTKDMIHYRLQKMFPDSGIDIWDVQLWM